MLGVGSLIYIRLVVCSQNPQFWLNLQITALSILSNFLKTHTLEIDLPSISSVPLDLYSADLHLTLHYEDIVGTVPTLRQFASLAASKTLVRNQLFKEYLLREYPLRHRI